MNEGIGGNTVTREGLVPPPDNTPGIERLDRDVFSHAGVTHLLLYLGTNDINRGASATQVIGGMQDIIKRSKARGIAVFGATIIARHNADGLVSPERRRSAIFGPRRRRRSRMKSTNGSVRAHRSMPWRTSIRRHVIRRIRI